MNWFEKKNEKTWSLDFVPTTDITTYELACCLKYIIYFSGARNFMDSYALKTNFDTEWGDDNIRRHFTWKKN